MRNASRDTGETDVEILYLLIPLAVVLAALIVWALLWAIRSGQFDDLERGGHEIFWDDPDDPPRN